MVAKVRLQTWKTWVQTWTWPMVRFRFYPHGWFQVLGPHFFRFRFKPGIEPEPLVALTLDGICSSMSHGLSVVVFKDYVWSIYALHEVVCFISLQSNRFSTKEPAYIVLELTRIDDSQLTFVLRSNISHVWRGTWFQVWTWVKRDPNLGSTWIRLRFCQLRRFRFWLS